MKNSDISFYIKIVFGLFAIYYSKQIIESLMSFFGVTQQQKAIEDEEEVKDEAIIQIDKDLKENKQKLTYPTSIYYNMADALQVAVEGDIYDQTHEKSIYNTFRKLQNDKDFLMLKKAFGTRLIDQPFFGEKSQTLTEALASDMAPGEIDVINNILRSKKMKSRV